MGNQILISGRDTLLVAIPFILLIGMSVFRAGEKLGMGKKRDGYKPSCGVEGDGEPIMRDPDGKLSRKRVRSR
jgi:hypothetical protein